MPYEAVGLFFNVCLLFYLTKKGESPMDYYIKLKNTQIPVTEEVYKAYCQGRFSSDAGCCYVIWDEGVIRTSNDNIQTN